MFDTPNHGIRKDLVHEVIDAANDLSPDVSISHLVASYQARHPGSFLAFYQSRSHPTCQVTLMRRGYHDGSDYLVQFTWPTYIWMVHEALEALRVEHRKPAPRNP
jgi:hypothetical protein